MNDLIQAQPKPEKPRCPICKRRVKQKRWWQKYDRPKCARLAHWRRQQEKLNEYRQLKAMLAQLQNPNSEGGEKR